MAPTAKTSVAEAPQTPLSTSVVPLIIGSQAFPSYRRIVPFAPTANTSVPELPQTPKSGCDVPLVIGSQSFPSWWRINPAHGATAPPDFPRR